MNKKELINYMECNGFDVDIIKQAREKTVYTTIKEMHHMHKVDLVAKGHTEVLKYINKDMLSGWDWAKILVKQPNLIKRAECYKLMNFDRDYILKRQPNLKKYL